MARELPIYLLVHPLLTPSPGAAGKSRRPFFLTSIGTRDLRTASLSHRLGPDRKACHHLVELDLKLPHARARRGEGGILRFELLFLASQLGSIGIHLVLLAGQAAKIV